MAIINSNDNDFENDVIKSDKKTLVDFWAPWCGPCLQLSPILEEYANANKDINIVKINIVDNPSIASKFNVFSIPCLMVYENGTKVKETKGFMPYDKLKEWVES